MLSPSLCLCWHVLVWNVYSVCMVKAIASWFNSQRMSLWGYHRDSSCKLNWYTVEDTILAFDSKAYNGIYASIYTDCCPTTPVQLASTHPCNTSTCLTDADKCTVLELVPRDTWPQKGVGYTKHTYMYDIYVSQLKEKIREI